MWSAVSGAIGAAKSAVGSAASAVGIVTNIEQLIKKHPDADIWEFNSKLPGDTDGAVYYLIDRYLKANKATYETNVGLNVQVTTNNLKTSAADGAAKKSAMKVSITGVVPSTVYVVEDPILKTVFVNAMETWNVDTTYAAPPLLLIYRKGMMTATRGGYRRRHRKSHRKSHRKAHRKSRRSGRKSRRHH